MRNREMFHWTQEAYLYIDLMCKREFVRGFRAIDAERSLEELKILDAGCGTGALTRELREHFEARSIFGCDIEKQSIDECKNQNPHIHYFVHDLLKPMQAGIKFDLVIFSTAIAQFSEAEQLKVINNVKAQLNKGGFIWITDVNDDATENLFNHLSANYQVVYKNKYSKHLFNKFFIFPLAKHLPISLLRIIDNLSIGSNVLTQMIIKT
ncbi:class I SAM-dependent methyltransferase [Moritella sp. 36]|uniref:class I SAM-dependent methyltransferase n=1 Tax=Moritella sp. 36 TaxID=2746233 RepID=UPI001BAD5CF4|nr:class I SAM-dependent methyltransferase [Moritella sp. 36]QUM87711.1 class I SAM-dependent methyltransferase [Moritella sp. 36]